MKKSKIETKTKMIPEIVRFEKDMQNVLKQGLLINMSYMSNKKGVEIALPQNITTHHANAIASYIKNTYNLPALFFARKHSINVYYEF